MDQRQKFILYMRNFIFGAEDSLISTVGLLSGVASVGIESGQIVVTGAILIFVEAFSMAVGSFLSERTTEEASSHFSRAKSRSLSAAVIMFFSYLVCGFIPLAPYVFFSGSGAFYGSIVASLIALFILGLVSAEILRTSLKRNALRMFFMGGSAVLLGIMVGQLVN